MVLIDRCKADAARMAHLNFVYMGYCISLIVIVIQVEFALLTVIHTLYLQTIHPFHYRYKKCIIQGLFTVVS